MKISVIIATRNRAHAIVECLSSIANSFLTAQISDGEIIVVDNRSNDNTAQIIKQWASTAPIPTKYIYESKSGVSFARNAGLNAASGDIFVLTDDDCQLSPTYISEIASYFSKDTDLVMRSGSVVLGDKTDLPITIKLVDQKRQWKKPMSLKEEGELLGGALIGCNISMKRETAMKTGYFDELLGPGTPCLAAEDTDFFYRAYLNGVTLETVPDLLIYHFHGRKTQDSADKLLKNYAIGNGALIIKYLFIYPHFSKHFYWSIKDLLKRKIIRTKYDESTEQTYDSTEVLFQLKGMITYILSLLSQKINLLKKLYK